MILYSICTTRYSKETQYLRSITHLYVTGSVKTGHNCTSLNLQYKALNTLGAYLHIVEKFRKFFERFFLKGVILKTCTSSYLPAQEEFENLCFVAVGPRISYGCLFTSHRNDRM